MSKATQIKAALVAGLVAAWLVGESRGPGAGPFPAWFALGLLLFGSINAIFSAPRTGWIRALTIVVAFVSLIEPGFQLIALVFTGLFWPLATSVSYWSGGGPKREVAWPEEPGVHARQARLAVAAMIVAIATAQIAYRLLYTHGLQQTAALFLGIPAILAVVTVFAVSPQSAVGVATKTVTVGLLVSLLFLQEGVLCVLLSAPLFYAVAIVVAGGLDVVRRDRHRLTSIVCSVVLVGVGPMSLEGVMPATTIDRHESVTVSRVVAASADEVSRALFEAPRFNRGLPAFLRSGFPTPLGTRIDAPEGATRWTIQFRGGEFRIDGIEPRVGDLVLELTEAQPGMLRWRAVADSSHMTHFLAWDDMIVRWEPLTPDSTRVTWTLAYRRGLDPAWYFGPMERYAVRLAAGYLIDAVATP